MEGNECYKFSTVKNYIERTAGKPVRVMLDIGCNIGAVTEMMRRYFPDAWILAFEPLEECYLRACQNLASDPRIKVLPAAVCGTHLYADDLGQHPRTMPTPLKIMRALPITGGGWYGGSAVVEEQRSDFDPEAFRVIPSPIPAFTLDEVVAFACKLFSVEEIDFVKMDCECCEHTSLGCASLDTLRRIRFIGGEYHGIGRFHRVMQGKLFQSHYVNLVGDAHLGSFFAERIGDPTTILVPDRNGMFQRRPWLCDEPLEWNCFREEFVLPDERAAHGLVGA